MALIDTETLFAYVVTNDQLYYLNDLIALVDKIPKVDAEKVVRCGQCLAWDRENKCCEHSGRIQVGENSYCDRGITKEDLRL